MHRRKREELKTRVSDRLARNAAASLACHVYKHLCTDPKVSLRTLRLVDQSLSSDTCGDAAGTSSCLNHLAVLVTEERVVAAVRKVLFNLETGPLTAILCARHCESVRSSVSLPPPTTPVGTEKMGVCSSWSCVQRLNQAYLHRVYY